MKKKLKNRVMNNLIYGFEWSMVIALLILEYLSGYKAGVMRHVYFKKIEYLSKIYTKNGMMIHLILLLFLFIVLMLIFKNRWNFNRKRSMLKFVLLSIILIVGFYFPYLAKLNTYAYILMFLEVAIGLEAIKATFYS
ncbi:MULTISPECIES: hypothetical protein [Psychrilyobacter]|uniref:Uncharacterized protein n=1 Tax=Psychrilyobacter piezotolerans TaxID=2293438 RepID=A0ABX9KD83_9FUSO|nr:MULTISPECIES: hypothetical protein [Psychrilyobacter]MCS5422932.1 hypothetical protein [Psychrilyobacter sp. S5]NDI79139.1 hypothetical protein [Psychrilyobacter piezotolerans]RDE58939.1 hypothetical protein DV867_14580 [Psychrilyobacter sp. S5]REI39495.1 hypothetical protein DYH56_14580 [Psychrilyobacter piezotolerans]